MAYTSPKKVFLSIERFERAEETQSSVSSGDTITLANAYPVKDTITLTVGGVEQTEGTDFTVDYDMREISYTGSDTGEAVITYGFAPYSDSSVQQSISAVESYIDDYTNSTYDGTSTVTDELYDGGDQKVYPFTKRPVKTVSKVALNNPEPGEPNPTYKTLSEGLSNDYIDYKELGIRFTGNGDTPSNEAEEVQVSYEYGYSGVPSDLEKAATEMVVEDLVFGTVSGAMVDGRDNFDPQTVDVNRSSYKEVLDRYRIMRLENMVTLAEEGTIS